MKKLKQALGSKKKGKDGGSELSECPDTGYDVNSSTNLPKLHKAAWSNDMSKAKSLLSNSKTVVDALDSENRTALHLACARGHVDMCKELLANGAKANLVDKSKKTPLHKSIDAHSVECIRQLIPRVNVNAVDQRGDNALHYAVKTGRLDVTRAIMAAGAKLDMKNQEGLTPLLLAVSCKFEELASSLLDKGANVNSATQSGKTALMIACEQGSPSTVSLLLRHKADVNATDQNGRTAEQLALAGGHRDCANLVKQAKSSAESDQKISPRPNAAAAGASSSRSKPVEDEDEDDEDEDEEEGESEAGTKVEKLRNEADEEDWSESESTSAGPGQRAAGKKASSSSQSPDSAKNAANTYSTVNKVGKTIDALAKGKARRPDSESEDEDEDDEEEDRKKSTKSGGTTRRKSDDEDEDWDSTETGGRSGPSSPRKAAAKKPDEVESVSDTEVIPVGVPTSTSGASPFTTASIEAPKPPKSNVFTINDSDSESESERNAALEKEREKQQQLEKEKREREERQEEEQRLKKEKEEKERQKKEKERLEEEERLKKEKEEKERQKKEKERLEEEQRLKKEKEKEEKEKERQRKEKEKEEKEKQKQKEKEEKEKQKAAASKPESKSVVLGVNNAAGNSSASNVNKALPAATTTTSTGPDSASASANANASSSNSSATPVAKPRSNAPVTATPTMAAAATEISNPLAQHVAALQEKLSTVEKQLDEENVQNREFAAKVDSLQRQNTDLQKQLDVAKQAKAKLEAEQTDRATATRKLELALQEESEKRKATESELAKLKKAADEKQVQAGKDKLDKDQAESALRKVKADLEDSRSKLAALEAENEKLKQKTTQLAQENDHLVNALHEAEALAQAKTNGADDDDADGDDGGDTARSARSTKSERRRDRDGTTGSIASVENYSLIMQIEELKSRHKTEEAKMLADNKALDERNEQLAKEVDVLKAALNEASLQHQLQLQKANDLIRAEQERKSKIEQELAAVRLAMAEGERAGTPNVRSHSPAMHSVHSAHSDRDSRSRDLLEAQLSKERRERAEMETKLAIKHEELQRADTFVLQLFNTLKHHYKPDPVLQPMIDEINRMVDVYNRQIAEPSGGSRRDSTVIPVPPPIASGSDLAQSVLEEAVTLRSSQKLLQSSKPRTDGSVYADESITLDRSKRYKTSASPGHPKDAIDHFGSGDERLSQDIGELTGGNTLRYGTYSGPHTVEVEAQTARVTDKRKLFGTLAGTLGSTSVSGHRKDDGLDRQSLESSSTIVAARSILQARQLTESTKAELERQRAVAELTSVQQQTSLRKLEAENEALQLILQREKQQLQQSQRDIAEQKIRSLVDTVEKIQTDIAASLKAAEEERKRSRKRNRRRPPAQDGPIGASYRSASLPGGPNGILQHANRTYPYNRSSNDVSYSSEEESEDDEADSADSATEDDISNAIQSQNTALQNVKLQLNGALDSMRRDPDSSTAVAHAVSGAVMPILESIQREVLRRPFGVKVKAKRRDDKKRMLGRIGQMLREQTAQLGGRIEELRDESDRRFVERGELEELSRSLELAQSRIQTAEEVEKVNQYLEQQLRAKQELERKRQQYNIAAEQKHSEAKRQLESEMRKLREALNNATSQKAELENENRSLSGLYRTVSQSRENILRSVRTGAQQPSATPVPAARIANGSYLSGTTPAPTPTPSQRSFMGYTSPDSDLFSSRLSQELKRSISLHVEAKMANGNGIYAPNRRPQPSDSLNSSWNGNGNGASSTDHHAYRDYIHRKYLI